MSKQLTILVTGNTGFIGRNMVKFLGKENVQIHPFSRNNNCDIFNKEQLISSVKDVDLVYHFAAYAKPGESILQPVKAIETNVKGCLNILEACRKNDVPLIYPSSCEVYGNSYQPLDESAPFKPTNPYAASKAAADAICIAYFESYGMDIKIVRLFNPYGPYQQLNKIIPTLYKQAIQGNDLSVYGEGKDTRDYVYISDIVSGLWQARQLQPGEVINLATGKVTTNYEIAKIILEITQSRSEITFVPYPQEFGNIKNQVGSYQKAKKLVDWSPKIPLKQGIIETIEWLQNFYKGG